MKAFYAAACGGPEVMRYGELPDPLPGRSEALVRVLASSVNPVDWKVRAGEVRLPGGGRFPRPLGTDFSGLVKRAAAGDGGFPPGSRVYGTVLTALGHAGAHAELAAVPASRLRLLPPGISFIQGAALPVAGLTALDGLRRCGDLAGKSVAINGATGGVGHLALQMSRARGARVTAVCSAGNAQLARGLGADEVIDYRREDVTGGGRTFDVLFDTSGRLTFARARPVLARGGTFVTTLPYPPVVLHSLWRGIIGGPQIALANMRGRPGDYRELEELVLSGRVRPVVDHVFSLEHAADAFALLEAGGAAGKIVITVD
jgi:NADPH:quinone reductase-like Zn-dependent oxidoreductase